MSALRLEQLNNGDSAMGGSFLDQLAYSERMAEFGQLAMGVIHELNTPLSVIAAAAQLVMREEGLPEHVLELLERIGDEAQRLSQMSRGMLTYGRLENTVGGEADVNLVIRDVLQLLRYEVRRRSVTVSQSLDHRIPILPLDGNRLKQVFINLVMNALHAMEKGGAIVIQSALTDDGGCEIQVSDTGHGISEDALPHIFDPFYTTKEPGLGTGLGLYVTREIVRAMAGSIKVESRLGDGTCFTLRFPLTVT